MAFVYVFALPWFLFALAYAACRAARSLLLAVGDWLHQKKKDR